MLTCYNMSLTPSFKLNKGEFTSNIFTMDVKIYVIDTAKADMGTIRNSIFISDGDLQEVSRYKVLESYNEKLASFYLKNKYIGKYHLGERGKPLSESFFFNVSHSKGMVVLAIADNDIGIDIEKIRPVKEDFIGYVCNEEERKYVKDNRSFFEVWTNKESLLKADGRGISSRVDEVPGLPIDGIRVYEEKEYRSASALYEDYVLTVTILGKETITMEIEEERI